MEKECNIEITEAINCDEYNESILAFLEEGSDEPIKTKKDGNIITRLIDSLLAFLKKAWASITGKMEHIDMNQLKNSELGKQMIETDIDAINQKIEKEQLQSRKGVQLISKITGKDDSEVADTIDNVVVPGVRVSKKYVPLAAAFASVQNSKRLETKFAAKMMVFKNGRDWNDLSRVEKKKTIEYIKEQQALFGAQAKSAANIVGKIKV